MSALAIVWLVSAVAGLALFASGWLFGRAAGRRVALAAGAPARVAPGGAPEPSTRPSSSPTLSSGSSDARQVEATTLSAPAAAAPRPPESPAQAPTPPPGPGPAAGGEGAAPWAPNPVGTIDLDVDDIASVDDFAASTDEVDDPTQVIGALADPTRPPLPPLAELPVGVASRAQGEASGGSGPAGPPRRPATTRRPTVPVNLSAGDFREGELARLLGELEADGVKRQLVLSDEVGLPLAAWRAEGTADIMAAMAAYSSEVGERFESLLAVGRARAVTIVCDDCFLEVRPFSAGEERYHVAALGPALPSPDLFMGIQARLVQALARTSGPPSGQTSGQTSDQASGGASPSTKPPGI